MMMKIRDHISSALFFLLGTAMQVRGVVKFLLHAAPNLLPVIGDVRDCGGT